MSWTVLEEYRDSGRSVVKVKCECGQEGTRRADHVYNGRTTGCKSCSSKKTLETTQNAFFAKRPHQGTGEITKTFFHTYKYQAQLRQLEFSITIEHVWDLFLEQGGKCALSGLQLAFSDKLKGNNPDWNEITASLDRIDSLKGYIVGNVQWVHKDINQMKMDLPESYFKYLCNSVALTSGI